MGAAQDGPVTPPRPPNGWAEVYATYGEPDLYQRHALHSTVAWEAKILAYVDLPALLRLSWDARWLVKRIRVHRLLTQEISAALTEIHATGLWDQLVSLGGAYEWRKQRGGSKLSLHSFGAAIDFDPLGNPLGKPGRFGLDQEAHKIVRIFEERGWTWGGRWDRRDDGHFQWARGV